MCSRILKFLQMSARNDRAVLVGARAVMRTHLTHDKKYLFSTVRRHLKNYCSETKLPAILYAIVPTSEQVDLQETCKQNIPSLTLVHLKYQSNNCFKLMILIKSYVINTRRFGVLKYFVIQCSVDWVNSYRHLGGNLLPSERQLPDHMPQYLTLDQHCCDDRRFRK